MEGVSGVKGSRNFGSISHRDGQALYLSVTPWPYAVLDCIVDKFCALTGHRLICCGRLMNWVGTVAHKHTKQFEVPADDEFLIKMHEWMGWERPYWADEDEDEAA